MDLLSHLHPPQVRCCEEALSPTTLAPHVMALRRHHAGEQSPHFRRLLRGVYTDWRSRVEVLATLAPYARAV